MRGIESRRLVSWGEVGMADVGVRRSRVKRAEAAVVVVGKYIVDVRFGGGG